MARVQAWPWLVVLLGVNSAAMHDHPRAHRPRTAFAPSAAQTFGQNWRAQRQDTPAWDASRTARAAAGAGCGIRSRPRSRALAVCMQFGEELATNVVVSAIAGTLQRGVELGFDNTNQWLGRQAPRLEQLSAPIFETIPETLIDKIPEMFLDKIPGLGDSKTLAVEDFQEELALRSAAALQESEQDRLRVPYNTPRALLLRGASEAAVQTAVYTTTMAVLRESVDMQSLPWTVQAIAGGLAGMHRSLICCPWDAITIQAQSHIYTNSTTRSLVNELGVKGLASGWQINWLRDVPAAMLWFPLYTWLNTNVADICRSPLQCCLVAGLSSGLAATLVAAPAEVIKTYITSRQEHFARMQTQQQAASWIDTLDAKMPSVKEAARKLVQEAGFGGLFAGTGSRVAKMIPSMAVNVGSYNVMKTAVLTSNFKTFVPIAPPVMYAELSLAGGNVVVLSPPPEAIAAAAAAAAAAAVPAFTAQVSTSAPFSSTGDAFIDTTMTASTLTVAALSSSLESLSAAAAVITEQAAQMSQIVQDSTVAGPQFAAATVAGCFENSQNVADLATELACQAASTCPQLVAVCHDVANLATSIPPLM